jgi:hypothetical protein
MTPDRNTNHLYLPFRSKVLSIITELSAWCEVHSPSHSAMMAEGFRSTARQQELYAQGRTTPGDIVTQKNGTSNPSNHQTCLAADITGSVHGEPTWDCPQPFWDYLQHLCHVHGLTSGSDWHGFVDMPHVEWPTSDHATYQAAAHWKAESGLK